MKTALKRAFSAVLALCLCLNLAVGMGSFAAAAEGSSLILHSTFDAGDRTETEIKNVVEGKTTKGTIGGAVTFETGIKGDAIKIYNTANNGKATNHVDYGTDFNELMGKQNFSIAFWVKSQSGTNNDCAIMGNKDYGVGVNKGIAIPFFGDGDIRVNFGTGALRVDNAGAGGQDMTWHHFVVTVDRNGVMTSYLDGQKKVEKNMAALKDKDASTGLPFVLGGDGKKVWNANATLDELRIYSGAITAAEVDDIYIADGGALLEVKDLIEKVEAMTPSGRFPKSLIDATKTELGEKKAALEVATEVSAMRTALNNARASYTTLLEGVAPLAKFCAISDTHMDVNPTVAEARKKELVDSLADMGTVAPDAVALLNAGDFTESGSAAEMEAFYDVMKVQTAFTAEQLLVVLGNHDVRGGCWNQEPNTPNAACDAYWKTIKARYLAGNKPYMPAGIADAGTVYFSKELGGYTFIALNTEKCLKDDIYMTDAQINWFEATMKASYEADPTKPVFIMAHQALNNTHWPNPAEYPFCSPTRNEDARVKAIMKKYPVGIFLSGHLHNGFGTSDKVYTDYGALIDVPSLSVPEGRGYSAKGSGFVAYIYADEVIFRARNFLTNTWLPQHDVSIKMSEMPKAAESVKLENTDPAVVTKAADGAAAWGVWETLSYTTWNPETQVGKFPTATVSFTGTSLTMYGQKAANGPMMSVTIDGAAAADADFYAATTTASDAEVWKSGALENKAHTAVFTFKSTWNEAAAPESQLGNLQVAIDYFLVGGTTEPPVPETDNYVKDYEDGVSGTWSGVTATVIPDPDNEANKILELKDFLRPSAGTHLGLGIDTSAPSIVDGTLSLRLKTESFKNFGFLYRAENSIKEANQFVNSPDIWYACNEGSHGAGYPAYPNGKHLQNLSTDTWLNVKLQFSGTNVEIAIDGIRYGVFDAGNSSTNAGKFGFRVWGPSHTVYVDDVTFTTEMLEMGTLYEEPPVVIPRVTYTSSATTTPSVPAGKAALDTNAPDNAYGLNTWYLTTAADGGFGVAFNAVSDSAFNAIYTTGAGDFKLRLPDGTEKVLTDKGPVMPTAAQVKVQVAHIGNLCTLYVNGVEVASLEDAALSATPGKIGLYNPGASAASITLTSCAVYELFYYENDFSDAAALGGWDKGTPTKTSDDKLSLNMNFVGNAVAMDTPIITNGVYEFDFQNKLPTGADPAKYDGRVGMLFRAYESEYQGLFYDVGSNWFWITDGPYGGISVDGALHAGETRHVKMTVNGTAVELELDGKTVYSGNMSALSPTVGRFGVRKQYSTSAFILDNLKISELCAIRPDDVAAVSETITGTEGGLTVTMDKVFPRVMDYKMNNKTLLGNQQKAYGLILNGKTYYPLVTAAKEGADALNYTLAIPTLGTTVKLKYQVVGNELQMKVTDIAETGAFKVESLAFEDAVLLSTTASDATASHASVETLGGWFQTQDVIYDNPTEMAKAPLGTSGRGYAMLSSGGLAGTVNNSGIEAATKLTAKFYQDENKKVIGTIGDGTLTVRTPLDLKNNTSRLPWSTVAICEDYNTDGAVNWQDAAANYRNIRTEIVGMDTMKDNMMYITMNFASQVQQPFLRTLDLGKSIYNYTDGFGQMVMHKGFAAEGHDDSHADYGGHVGVRQGGAADFNYIMEQGEDYNIKYGIHINVSEHNPDAYYFNEDIMHRPLGANWGWIDQAYWVNEREDILSGNRAANLARLKDTLPKLAFTYVDIYNGSTWMAEDLVKELNKNGFIAGTEFGGSMELGAAFTHWGHDRAYPNHGNNSTILRFVKPDLDIFVTNALFNGSNMPLVGSWGNTNNVKDASQSFFNNVLPGKYLQHLNVLKVTDTSVTFSDGVKTEKVADPNNAGKFLVNMTQDGKLMASWAWIEKTPGAADPQNWATSDTGPATVFIPWYGEASTAKNPEEAAKVYHWNPEGGTTSWDVPAQWTQNSITSADVYQLSGDKKEKISTVAVESGKITLTAAAETGYVLYPAGSAAPKVATDFGSGSGMQNTGFEDTSLAGWTVDEAAGADASVMKTANWETRLKIAGTDGQSASLTQPITGLEAGKDYTLYLFANAGEKGRVDVTVTAGDETYAASALPTTLRHYDQSKYFNLAQGAGAYDNFQKISVPFRVPAGATTATLTLTGTLGGNDTAVFADDVTLFDNLTVPKIAGRGDYKDYVLYEDFENVDQGLGAFTYSYLSGGYTHLAEYKAEMNQFTDYVVSGNFSLKSNEFGLVGEALRTRPNQSKLEANTQYELACRYETGVNGAYALTVKRPDGTVVCSAPLDAVPLRGEGAAVKVSFATGDYDDAYLALEYKADITKLPYASTGEKPEGSGMEYYYLSLDDVTIKKAASDLDEKILSLGAMRTNTYEGVAPMLMGRVAATYESGRKGYVGVQWADIDPAALATAGTLTVKGTVQGTKLSAEYTVTVMEAESTVETADVRALVTYAKAQKAASTYAVVIPAVKTAFEQALTAAEAGCGEAAPATQPSGDYYTLLARTHLLDYVGDKAKLDALYLASKDLTRGDTAEADWVTFTKALARAKAALDAENILQAEYDLLHQQLTAAAAALTETPPYIPPYNPSEDPDEKTETVKNEDGSTTQIVTDKKTGDAVATTQYPDGTKVVTTIPKNGEPTAKVTVPSGKEHITVTVPIQNATPGMVAIIVHADGTEEIVKCSAATEGGMKVQLEGGATLKFRDNSKQFNDVKSDAWYADAVAFVSSRELFSGVSDKEFDTEMAMTRAMLVTVLCRLSGDQVAQGDTWFEGSMDWAKAQKISDGTNPDMKISREGLAVMLYRYAKADKVAADLTAFPDGEDISDWARDAMNWAVKIGLINGKDGKLAPTGDASRAEVATILQRFVELIELAG